MSRSRRSVQDAVRFIIAQDPYLYRGLRMRIINYSAAARYIHEDVETLAGDHVDPNTIVTAIMRFSRETRQQRSLEVIRPLLDSRLNLVTDVVKLTMKATTRDQVEIIERLVELQKKGLRLKFHQFSSSIKVITTGDAVNEIFNVLRDYEPEVEEGFAELNITIFDRDDRVDRIALLTDLLFRNGVHIIDAFFTRSEMNLILNEEDASKAFEVLRSQTR
jgi:hypothetical protein